MILCVGPNERIQLVTNVAAAIDVHISAMDYDGANVVAYRKDTAITTGTTTEVMSPPSNGVVRNAKLINVRNKDGANSCTVTVQLFDGTTTLELYKVTLVPGKTLQYAEGVGWSTGSGIILPTTGDVALSVRVAADTYDRFQALAGGVLQWGPGNAAPSANLYFGGTAAPTPGLKTDSSLNFSPIPGTAAIRTYQLAGDNVFVQRYVAADQPLFTLVADGSLRWGPGGSVAWDTNLYRFAANFLATQGNFAANAQQVGQITLQSQGGYPIIFFGQAQDVNLYRWGAGYLRTDGWMAANIFSSEPTTAGDGWAYVAKVLGDTQPRFIIGRSGFLQWGPGSSAVDTTLARSASFPGFLEGNFLTPYGANAWVGFVNPSMAGSPNTLVGLYYDAPNNRAVLSALSGGVAWRDILIGTSNLLVNRINFGNSNANFDASLWRSAANQLYTPGSFVFGDAIILGVGAYTSVGKWFLNVDGSQQWGPGDWSRDTNLYRQQAATLATDGQLVVMAGSPNQIQLANNGSIYLGNAYDCNLYRVGAGILGVGGGLVVNNGYLWVQADSVAGRIAFGPSADVYLMRGGANILQTPNGFYASGQIVANNGAAGMILLAADGRLYFGGASDTNLYRQAADRLKTDDSLEIGSTLSVLSYAIINGDIGARWGGADQVFIGDQGGKAAIQFGSPADVNLYREAADVLATDDQFHVKNAGGVKFNDGTVQTTAPTSGKAVTNVSQLPASPAAGTLAWILTSVEGPVLLVYDGTQWVSESKLAAWMGSNNAGPTISNSGTLDMISMNSAIINMNWMPYAPFVNVGLIAQLRITGQINIGAGPNNGIVEATYGMSNVSSVVPVTTTLCSPSIGIGSPTQNNWSLRQSAWLDVLPTPTLADFILPSMRMRNTASLSISIRQINIELRWRY